MTYVFLVYGLAFCALGLAIWIYPKQPDTMKLQRYLSFLVAFSLLHGICELLDMARTIDGDAAGLIIASSVLLPLSYVALLVFGAAALQNQTGVRGLVYWLPLGLVAGWVVAVLAFDDRTLGVAIASRYLLGATGAALTGWAFVRERNKVEEFGGDIVRWRLWPVAICFGIYAALTLVGPAASFFPASVINVDRFNDVVGLPVQVFRGLVGCGIAVSLISLLSVFHWASDRCIAESEMRYRSLVEMSPIGVAIILDGRIELVNSRSLAILGAERREQLLGCPLGDLVHEDSRKAVERQISAVHLGDLAPVQDVRFKRLDGDPIDVTIGAATLELSGRPATQIVFEDVTPRKRQEAELAEHRERLENLVYRRTVYLQEALANVKTLRGTIPLCAWCKRIRNDAGDWEQIETFIAMRTEARLTHSICPDCESDVATVLKPKPGKL